MLKKCDRCGKLRDKAMVRIDSDKKSRCIRCCDAWIQWNLMEKIR